MVRHCLKEADMDVVGALFGLVYRGDQVDLYIGDDENWYYRLSFHQNWLPDLNRVVQNSCKRFK